MDEAEKSIAEWHPSKGDQYKALCDYLKHISTLSAGSILLISTLLDKVFRQPTARGWVVIAVMAFLVSLVASSVAYGLTALLFPRPGVYVASMREGTVMAACSFFTWLGFVFGIISVAIFFLLNWQA